MKITGKTLESELKICQYRNNNSGSLFLPGFGIVILDKIPCLA